MSRPLQGDHLCPPSPDSPSVMSALAALFFSALNLFTRPQCLIGLQLAWQRIGHDYALQRSIAWGDYMTNHLGSRASAVKRAPMLRERLIKPLQWFKPRRWHATANYPENCQ